MSYGETICPVEVANQHGGRGISIVVRGADEGRVHAPHRDGRGCCFRFACEPGVDDREVSPWERRVDLLVSNMGTQPRLRGARLWFYGSGANHDLLGLPRTGGRPDRPYREDRAIMCVVIRVSCALISAGRGCGLCRKPQPALSGLDIHPYTGW